MLISISEIFASVTGLEYAYMKAPPSMKSFVQARYLLANAFGYALGETFTPLISDPQIMLLFAGLCAGSFAVGCIFWVLFHRFDGREDKMNSFDAKHDELENNRVFNENSNDVTIDARQSEKKHRVRMDGIRGQWVKLTKLKSFSDWK
jgi:POT family proton-dependent oligopeptide transporter